MSISIAGVYNRPGRARGVDMCGGMVGVVGAVWLAVTERKVIGFMVAGV